MTELRLIPSTDGRLGRHVEHDPRSRAFAATGTLQADEPLPDLMLHYHFGTVLDQGQLGSCTGNAMAQCLVSGNLRKRGRTMSERKARELYHLATQLDGFDGEWPPDDTGSSGLGVAKAAQQLGYIDRYEHAFGVDHAMAALTQGPVIVGTAWRARSSAATSTCASGGRPATSCSSTRGARGGASPRSRTCGTAGPSG